MGQVYLIFYSSGTGYFVPDTTGKYYAKYLEKVNDIRIGIGRDSFPPGYYVQTH